MNTNKCECERAKAGGAQCMVHNPPFPVPTKEPANWEEEFDTEKAKFTVYNKQSGSRFLDEEVLKSFISKVRQEAYEEGKESVKETAKEWHEEKMEAAMMKSYQDGVRDTVRGLLEHADANIEDIKFNRPWFRLHIKTYAKSKGITLE
jgi:hypothetical protein